MESLAQLPKRIAVESAVVMAKPVKWWKATSTTPRGWVSNPRQHFSGAVVLLTAGGELKSGSSSSSWLELDSSALVNTQETQNKTQLHSNVCDILFAS